MTETKNLSNDEIGVTMDEVVRVVRVLAGLNASHTCILGTVYTRIDMPENAGRDVKAFRAFCDWAEKESQAFERELLELARTKFGSHNCTDGFDVLDLADSVEEMVRLANVAAATEFLTGFVVAVDALTEDFNTRYVDKAIEELGDNHVKTPQNMVDIWHELQSLAHELDGVSVPGSNADDDNDTVEETGTHAV